VVLLLGAVAGCGSLRFYSQSVRGGLEVLLKRRSIDKLLAHPGTPEDLKERLRLVRDIRTFATEVLALPDNGSYRHYTDLERPYAVWNVVAAPELSTDPLVWCFPFAGCVSYRGYFAREGAERFAAKLAAEGYDTSVGGVTTYSTLGWFKDPVLNTFLHLPDERLAGVLFHELAHQRVYLPGDTAFNESFATVVELEGVRRWLAARQHPEAEATLAAYRQAEARGARFTELVLTFRERLDGAYRSDHDDVWKRTRKAELLADLQAEYRQLRDEEWEGYSGYDGWFARDLNNAHLAAVGAYHELVPGFERLLQEAGGDLDLFFGAVEAVAELPADARRERLQGAGGSS
jgi:predicted aminopeptidase